MTEKRFHFGYVLGDTGLIDEQAEYKWFIENCCNITDLKKNWKTVCDKLNELADENEQLKKGISLFKGEDARHYQRWVNQIKKYLDESNSDFEYDEDFIIKIALSYTLQSLRNGESLKRFQWGYKELK